MSNETENEKNDELDKELQNWKPDETGPGQDQATAGNDEVRKALQTKLAQGGSISSSDVQGGGDNTPGSDLVDKFDKARKEETEVRSDEEVDEATGSYDDPNSKPFAAATNLLRQMQEIPEPLRELFNPGAIIDTKITPQDKETFFTAIIDNERFTKTYYFMDNRLSVKFQSRTEQELRAYWAQFAYEGRTQDLTAFEQRSRGRDLAFALGVAAFGDETFPAIAPKDLLPTRIKDEDGRSVRQDPAWVERADIWSQKHPGLLAMIFKKFREFEFLYWRLTAEADVENF